MLRCYLHSRKLVWLCPTHQSGARATLPNDVVEAEDIQLDNLELTVNELSTTSAEKAQELISPPTTPIVADSIPTKV